MRVLALDPGERVGWAAGHVGWADVMRGGMVVRQGLRPLVVEQHGISFLKDMALAVHRALVEEQKYDVVVMESYRISAQPERLRAHIGSDVPTLQFVGMVRLCCWLSNTKLVTQGPSAKTSALRSVQNPEGEDIRKRLAKLPKAHDEAHDGDALLHLWHFYFDRFV